MKKCAFTFIFALLVLTANAQSDKTQGTQALKELAATPKIKVFPNPAMNVVNVLGVLNTQKAQITISNMYGKVVLAHEWEVRNNALNIPVSNLEAGIYLITINSEEQQVQTKFLKQ